MESTKPANRAAMQRRKSRLGAMSVKAGLKGGAESRAMLHFPLLAAMAGRTHRLISVQFRS
jgi:hypothetical protein